MQTRVFILLALTLLNVSHSKQFDQLQGTQLTGCVLLETPYVVRDTRYRTGFSGIALDYLSLLKDDLGFSIDLKPCDTSLSWNSFIDRLDNCSTLSPSDDSRQDECDIQIGVAPFTVSDERMGKVIFLESFDDTSLQVVTLNEYLRADKGHSLWFVYYPFSLPTWTLIVVGILLHAGGAFFFPPFCDPDEDTNVLDEDEPVDEEAPIDDMGNEDPEESHASFAETVTNYGGRAKNMTKTFLRSVAQTYAAYLGSPLQSIGDSDLANKPISVAYLLLGVSYGLLVIHFYQSSLSALTFNAKYSSDFKSIEDLRSCKIDIADVGFMGAGYTERYIVSTIYRPNREKCTTQGSWTADPKRFLSHSKGSDALRDKKIKYFIGPRGSMLFGAQRNCQLYASVSQPFSTSQIAFTVPKNFNQTIIEMLNQATRILKEERRLETAETIANRNKCQDPKDYEMTLPRLLAAFLFFFAAGLFLFVYRFLHLRRDRALLRQLDKRQQAMLEAIPAPGAAYAR